MRWQLASSVAYYGIKNPQRILLYAEDFSHTILFSYFAIRFAA